MNQHPLGPFFQSSTRSSVHPSAIAHVQPGWTGAGAPHRLGADQHQALGCAAIYSRSRSRVTLRRRLDVGKVVVKALVRHFEIVTGLHVDEQFSFPACQPGKP